jgi:hypothetical protein
MLFTEAIGVVCESHSKHTSTLCGTLQSCFNVIRTFAAKLEAGIETGAKKQLMKSKLLISELIFERGNS